MTKRITKKQMSSIKEILKKIADNVNEYKSTGLSFDDVFKANMDNELKQFTEELSESEYHDFMRRSFEMLLHDDPEFTGSIFNVLLGRSLDDIMKDITYDSKKTTFRKLVNKVAKTNKISETSIIFKLKYNPALDESKDIDSRIAQLNKMLKVKK